MRHRVAALLAVTAVLGLGGCGSAADGSPKARVTPAHSPFPTSSTSATSSTPSPNRTTEITATCAGGPWAFGFTPVEAASGNRYLTIRVHNCGSSAATVPSRPEVTARDDNGAVVPVHWQWQAATSRITIRPGAEKSLTLHWLSSGRCERGATALDIGFDGRTAHLRDCLQLGGLSDVTGEQATGDATWAMPH